MFSENLTKFLGADITVFDMTNTYLKVLLLFSPAFICNNVLLCVVRNDGNPQLAMIATIGSSFSNIILDYIFIFPYKMGIFGAVLATGIAPVIGIVILAPHWLKKNKEISYGKIKIVFGNGENKFFIRISFFAGTDIIRCCDDYI